MSEGERYSIPFAMCHAFYFYGMSWRVFECVFGLHNELLSPADG